MKLKKIMQLLQNYIVSTVRFGRERWCLPYAGFFRDNTDHLVLFLPNQHGIYYFFAENNNVAKFLYSLFYSRQDCFLPYHVLFKCSCLFPIHRLRNIEIHFLRDNTQERFQPVTTRVVSLVGKILTAPKGSPNKQVGCSFQNFLDT